METYLVSKISITETLKNLPVKKPVLFPTSIFNAVTLRVMTRRLKKSGYDFKVTERGLINEVQVTRLK